MVMQMIIVDKIFVSFVIIVIANLIPTKARILGMEDILVSKDIKMVSLTRFAALVQWKNNSFVQSRSGFDSLMRLFAPEFHWLNIPLVRERQRVQFPPGALD